MKQQSTKISFKWQSYFEILIYPFLTYYNRMYNKSNSLNQRRIWTDIAEDIGHVLRKQMLNNQLLGRAHNRHQNSTQLLTKSLFANHKISAVLKDSPPKKLYFMRESSQSLSRKTQPQKYPKFENLRVIKKLFEERENSETEPSKFKILSEQKRKEAEMLKSYLHKLKVENNIKKIHNLREKCYKVWKLRITNSTKKTQPPEAQYC